MKIRILFFLVLFLFFSACASIETSNKNQISGNESQEWSVCKNTILKNKSNVTKAHLAHCETLLLGKTFTFERNWYAKQYNVSHDVSKYRSKVMQDAGKLAEQVAKDKVHHAGYFYAHQPDFSINILIKNHPDISRIKELYKDKSWSHFVKIKQVKYSMKDLEIIRKEAKKVFYGLKTPFMSSLIIQKNAVGFVIENKENFLFKLKKKKIKLHERVNVDEGMPYVCTLIGCDNRITVNLANKLQPDNYQIKIQFDKKKPNTYNAVVTNKLTKECKKSKFPPPIKATKSTIRDAGLLVNSEVCKNKNLYSAKSVAPFNSFVVTHNPNSIEKTNDLVTMKIEITNGKGKTILNQEKIIRFDPKTKNQPNGSRCEPICYKANVSL